jgi:hypothetical protein
MYVCVSVWLCMYLLMSDCVWYVCVRACVCLGEFVCMHVRQCACVFVYGCVYVLLCMCMCLRLRECVFHLCACLSCLVICARVCLFVLLFVRDCVVADEAKVETVRVCVNPRGYILLPITSAGLRTSLSMWKSLCAAPAVTKRVCLPLLVKM